MGSVSATSGPDTDLQVPDKILQNFGMKTSFSKDVPKLPHIRLGIQYFWTKSSGLRLLDIVATEIRFFALKSKKKKKVLDRGQNVFSV